MQKQLKAEAMDRREIVSEFGKSDTAPRSIRSAVSDCEAWRAFAIYLAVINMRKPGAYAVVIASEDYRGRAVTHLHQIDQLARILGCSMRVEEDGACLRPD